MLLLDNIDSKTVKAADLSSENRRSRISKLPIRESCYGCVDLLKGTHVLADGYPRFVIDANRITGGGISSGLDKPWRWWRFCWTRKLRGTLVVLFLEHTKIFFDPMLLQVYSAETLSLRS